MTAQNGEASLTASDITDSSALVHGLTAEEIRTLTAKCIEAKAAAYCPYSLFRVGSALLTHSGSYISGANVENASYPVGSCAERVAMGSAVFAGHRRGDFRAIAVATDAPEPSSPCGMCRQFLREFCGEDVPVVMVGREGGEGKVVVRTVGELLPLGFGPESLPPREELAKVGEGGKS
ncbi:hypothetical protein H2201_000622 [Coniosporium apollinis]|uniref:Cytidine deaminase n=1 Tax=Coniosporium apollinis TaxID=61459 RepID=A0ABQ9P3V3_9PEZI|nr:hypothetical protein H2201_000622 [Coniosporium apollinis]